MKIAKTSRSEGLVWGEVEDEEGKIFIAVVYKAPGSFARIRELNQQLMDELSEDIFYFQEQGRVCVMGDFNCRIGEEASRIVSEQTEEEKEMIYKRRSEDKTVSQGGRAFMRYMNDHNDHWKWCEEESLFFQCSDWRKFSDRLCYKRSKFVQEDQKL